MRDDAMNRRVVTKVNLRVVRIKYLRYQKDVSHRWRIAITKLANTLIIGKTFL